MNNETVVINQTQVASKTPSTIALVLGIISVLCGLVAILSVPLGIAAIITGSMGIKKNAGKGMAIAGIITGSIGLIAGLLSFLLIFLAVPALQRNQQDVQIKNDVGAASSAIVSYQTDNRGVLPTSDEFNSASFKQQYLPDTSTDILYTPGTSCDGISSPRLYSVSAELSKGSKYCLD